MIAMDSEMTVKEFLEVARAKLGICARGETSITTNGRSIPATRINMALS